MSAPPTASAGVVPVSGDDAVGVNTQAVTKVTGVVANSAMELEAHTSALNTLDRYFYTHFIRFASFSWTTDQPMGYPLYALELSPFNVHTPLKYVLGLYNTWSGGLELKIEIAGTGFNGGKLLFVRFPPNVNPDDYDINSATVFDSVILDPKSQVSTGLICNDYRTTMFHYTTRYDDSFGELQNCMGRLRAMVMLPLISSGPSLAAVNVQVSARLAPDFVVGQMVPPLMKRPGSIIHWDAPFLALGSKGVCNAPFNNDALAVSKLIVTTENSRPFYNVDLLVKTDGWPLVEDPDSRKLLWGPLLSGFSQDAKYDTVNKMWGNFSNKPTGTKGTLRVALTGTYYVWVQGSPAAQPAFTTIDYSVGNDVYVVDGHFTPGETSIGAFGVARDQYGYPSQSQGISMQPRYTAGKILTCPNNESIVSFCTMHDNDDGLAGFLQTRELIQQLMKTEQNLGKNSYLFQLMDVSTDSPLIYIRLYPDGYCTSTKTTQPMVFQLQNVYLRYLYPLDVRAKMPTITSTMAIQNDVYQAREKITRVLKRLPTGWSELSSSDV